MAFSRTASVPLANRPSWENEATQARSLADGFQEHTIDIREYAPVKELTTVQQVIDASMANQVMNARSTYRDTEKDEASKKARENV